MHKFLIVFLLSLINVSANAQALTPMRDEIATYTDRFALRLEAINPYDTPQQFSIAVYDKDFEPTVAVALSKEIIVPPGERASFLVLGSAHHDQIYVCVGASPMRGRAGAQIRGEVCGKYDIVRRY